MCGIAWRVHHDHTDESSSAGLSLAVIAAVGCASLAGHTFVRRTLNCASLRTLALSYRSRFLLRLAIAETGMWIAFFVSRVSGPWWVFYVGAVFTIIGFYRTAPTRRHLQQDQDQLSLSGCQLFLTEALRTPAPAAKT
jgi:hypothetical protein